jgi:hypothetical protein
VTLFAVETVERALCRHRMSSRRFDAFFLFGQDRHPVRQKKRETEGYGYADFLKEFDSLLGSMAEATIKLIELEHDRVKIEFTEHRLQAFVRKVRPEYYEVWNADGLVIAQSPYLVESDLISGPDITDDTASAPEGSR